ncbi:hypothetical protein MD535_09260 [Vibrio sp. ZSDZ65]|uniref:Uncharacterized protein n=1 Tax=Vibrio qingdaonensis TaxID=2829491 RepID=A0A9X3HWF5_9VIBR|nr:hypothetical protein [Vibrio qingdaonensis]MCW8346193.1 hypothetical protein [Vibrio qingdaonensis]
MARRWWGLWAICLAFTASAEVFDGFPDVVVCEVGKPYRNGSITLFAEYQDQNRIVYYRSMDGKQGVKIDRKGLVSASHKHSKNNCVGQTLNTLMSKGKTFNFQMIEKE